MNTSVLRYVVARGGVGTYRVPTHQRITFRPSCHLSRNDIDIYKTSFFLGKVVLSLRLKATVEKVI